MAKQYGLIIPSKSKLTPANEIRKPSIFDQNSEDSDSSPEADRPTGITKTLKRRDRIAIEKAFEEDPTVYQYDEVYDDIDRKRKESKTSREDSDKKPKYIGKLLAAADKRKRENERRIERQVQKERELEGDEFEGKESFVTSAYRKKLEELKKLEEEEKREEYLEQIGDVKKQGNLDGFYRHLYDQKVNFDDKDDKDNENNENTEKIKDAEETTDLKKQIKKQSNQSQRKYRKRGSVSSESETTEDKPTDQSRPKKMEHLPSNLDADSDFSIDSESSDEGEPKVDKVKVEEEEGKVEEPTEPKPNLEDVKKEEKMEEEVVEEKKPKIDIWEKRTVGTVFEEALQRYFERKALKESLGA